MVSVPACVSGFESKHVITKRDYVFINVLEVGRHVLWVLVTEVLPHRSKPCAVDVFDDDSHGGSASRGLEHNTRLPAGHPRARPCRRGWRSGGGRCRFGCRPTEWKAGAATPAPVVPTSADCMSRRSRSLRRSASSSSRSRPRLSPGPRPSATGKYGYACSLCCVRSRPIIASSASARTSTSALTITRIRSVPNPHSA